VYEANGKAMELKAGTADEAREWMAALKKLAKESDVGLRDSEVEFRDSTIRNSQALPTPNIRASQYKEDEEAAIFVSVCFDDTSQRQQQQMC
jgi:hypothetical protein